MIQLSQETRDLLLSNSVHREIILRFPDDDFEIGSSNIVSESFELNQSICDGRKFRLGGGITGKMEISLIGIDTELTGKKVNVFLKSTYSLNRLVPSPTLYPSPTLLIGEPRQTVEYQLFSGKVHSAKKQKNRAVKKLTAYDAMYDFSKKTISADALTSYDDHHQNPLPQLKAFTLDLLDNLFNEYSNIYNDSTAGFSNTKLLFLDRDSINAAAKKGVTVLELLKAYAEANAGFIICEGDGNLRVKSLSEYTDDPNDPPFTTRKKSVDEVIPAYRSLSFEEYTTEPITYLSFMYENDKKYFLIASRDYSWYVAENIIFRMCSNISHFVNGYWNTNGANYLFYYLLTFRPFKADVFARWWLEPGDRIQIRTGYNDVETVDSFVLSRKIKGINGMSVTIEAKGSEYLDNEEVDSIE